VKYDSYAKAKTACDALGDEKCSGVYDQKCDMKNEFYTCKFHAVETHLSHLKDCVYTRPCPKTAKGTGTKKHGRSLCHEDEDEDKTTAMRWVDVGSKVVCDEGAGEVFLKSSSGKVSNIEQCKRSCHETAQCKSITYFKSRYCSHFSTSCANTKRNGKAVGSYYRTAEAPTTKKPSASKRSWTSAVSNSQCDTRAGEVFLKSSPGKGSSLDQCKKSCEDAGDCQSITYFKNGYCGHFSTLCTKTKTKRKAVVLRFIEAPVSAAPATTRPPIRFVEVGSKVVCDTAAGELYLDSSPGKVSNSGECKSLCQANSKCNSITYFKSGFCSHFSTSCTKTKKHNKVFKSFRVTTARRNLRGN